jgi:hypothetical protein
LCGAFYSEPQKDFFFFSLPTNIRLGWKSLPGTNARAYHENA